MKSDTKLILWLIVTVALKEKEKNSTRKIQWQIAGAVSHHKPFIGKLNYLTVTFLTNQHDGN